MIQGLRTVIYHVKDMEIAKEWFTKILEKPPYFDQPFYVGYNVEGFELGLQPSERTGMIANTVTAYWGVKDARGKYDELIKNGASPGAPITDVGEGILIGTVIDPLGNTFGIIENPHFVYQPA